MIRLVSGVIEALRDDTYAAQDEYRFEAPPGVQHPQIRSLPFRDGLDNLLNPRLHDSTWRIWGKVSVPWAQDGGSINQEANSSPVRWKCRLGASASQDRGTRVRPVYGSQSTHGPLHDAQSAQWRSLLSFGVRGSVMDRQTQARLRRQRQSQKRQGNCSKTWGGAEHGGARIPRLSSGVKEQETTAHSRGGM